MKKQLKALALAIVAVMLATSTPTPVERWLPPVALLAQTSVSTTTFGAAVASTDTVLTVASTSGMTAGGPSTGTAITTSGGATFLFPANGTEQMRVVEVISSTRVRVQRALSGQRAAYASGATIYFGPGTAFKTTDPPVGTCAATDWLYTPWINISNGALSTCTNSRVITSYPGTLLSRSSQAGLGYTAGCAVTQATSKSTDVTCTGGTGEITMNGAALAAATNVAFTLTNTTIAAGDYVLVQHVSGGTANAYTTTAVAAAGSATINVRNDTAGSLSEAIVLKFVVIRAATS